MKLARFLLCVLPLACGVVEPVPDTLTEEPQVRQMRDAIQGGTIEQGWPQVMGMLIYAQGGYATCTGSLIAPNLVLTARHCIAPTNDAVIGNCGATNAFGASYSLNSF